MTKRIKVKLEVVFNVLPDEFDGLLKEDGTLDYEEIEKLKNEILNDQQAESASVIIQLLEEGEDA